MAPRWSPHSILSIEWMWPQSANSIMVGSADNKKLLPSDPAAAGRVLTATTSLSTAAFQWIKEIISIMRRMRPMWVWTKLLLMRFFSGFVMRISKASTLANVVLLSGKAMIWAGWHISSQKWIFTRTHVILAPLNWQNVIDCILLPYLHISWWSVSWLVDDEDAPPLLHSTPAADSRSINTCMLLPGLCILVVIISTLHSLWRCRTIFLAIPTM